MKLDQTALVRKKVRPSPFGNSSYAVNATTCGCNVQTRAPVCVIIRGALSQHTTLGVVS